MEGPAAHRFASLKFRRQQPIGPYIVDFVCFERRLITELDGGQHIENKGYDEDRTRWLNDQGYQVLRFWNHETLTETESVLGAIELALRASSPSP